MRFPLQEWRVHSTGDIPVGEGIGNKGLGFRSVETLTDDPRIYSQAIAQEAVHFNGYCFRFARPEEVLQEASSITPIEVAKKVAEILPRYLAALPILEQPEDIREFARLGFATVVHIPLSSEAAVSVARAQVLALLATESPLLLFLDRLSRVIIEVVDGETSTRKVLARSVVQKRAPSSSSASEYVIVAIQPSGRRYPIAKRRMNRTKLRVGVPRRTKCHAHPLRRAGSWLLAHDERHRDAERTDHRNQQKRRPQPPRSPWTKLVEHGCCLFGTTAWN
jgi:hypothetical protein